MSFIMLIKHTQCDPLNKITKKRYSRFHDYTVSVRNYLICKFNFLISSSLDNYL